MFGRRHISATVLLIVACLAQPTTAAAQFGEGKKFVGAHVGLSGVGSAPAFGLNGEVAYNDNIGIGAWLDTWGYGQDFSGIGGGSWNVRYVSVAATGAWHFPIESNPKIDPFAGLAVGYFLVSNTWEGTGTTIDFSGSGSRVFLDGVAGIRYHFKENLSAVVRAGASVSYLTVGVDLTL